MLLMSGGSPKSSRICAFCTWRSRASRPTTSPPQSILSGNSATNETPTSRKAGAIAAAWNADPEGAATRLLLYIVFRWHAQASEGLCVLSAKTPYRSFYRHHENLFLVRGEYELLFPAADQVRDKDPSRNFYSTQNYVIRQMRVEGVLDDQDCRPAQGDVIR